MAPGCLPFSKEPADIAGDAILVDAGMRRQATPERLRGRAGLTIGLGPGFVAGDTADPLDLPSLAIGGRILAAAAALQTFGQRH